MSCTDCFSGQRHEGQPMGSMTKLHGLDTYVVEPPQGRQPKGIIVYIPDAFGIDFVNNKLLADAYARGGDFKVYLPDFMLGRSCPSWFMDSMKIIMSPGNYLSKVYHIFWGIYAFVPWLYFCRHSRSLAIVKSFFTALRQAEGLSLPIGAVGFCWGGKHVVLLTHTENYLASPDGENGAAKPLIDAAFTGHPAHLEIPRDISRITVPTSFALAERDHHVKVPGDSDVATRIIEGLPANQRGEVRVYNNCAHGFCTRADPLSGDITRQAAEAETQAVEWFTLKLRSKPATR